MSDKQQNSTAVNVAGYLRNHYANFANLAVKKIENGMLKFSHRLEPRARKHNLTDSLSFRIHDPLWILTRQWQFGEFRGNDAGSAIVVSARLEAHRLKTLRFGQQQIDFAKSSDVSVEPMVERLDEDLTPQVGVEAAFYFKRLLKSDAVLSPNLKLILTRCKQLYPLTDESPMVSVEHTGVKDFCYQQNARLNKFQSAYKGVAFDGRSLYVDLKRGSRQLCSDFPAAEVVCKTYVQWFESHYLPNSGGGKSAWNTQKLGYEFEVDTAKEKYVAEDYHSGRVSWYTFDYSSGKGKHNPDRKYIFTGLPTLACFDGSPNKRLWQMEDRKVYMGNSDEMQSTANGVTLQYVTMYGNDWMLIPLDVTVGSVVTVKQISVRDTFGISTTIDRRAGTDSASGAHTFGQRWEMFTQAPVHVMSKVKDARVSADGLFFPPALPFTIESQPIEEIQFLRDEMANMVWGVERCVNDGCGSALDCNLLASRTAQFIDELNKDILQQQSAGEESVVSVSQNTAGKAQVEHSEKASDYHYVLQNSVPLNWIPFLPQRIQGDKTRREIALRRGKMPIYLADMKAYLPARPLSALLQVHAGSNSVKEVPLYINEEEIIGVGTKIVRNFQRSRWLNGQVYTWYGTQKQISQMQGDSGLMFDELIEK